MNGENETTTPIYNEHHITQTRGSKFHFSKENNLEMQTEGIFLHSGNSLTRIPKHGCGNFSYDKQKLVSKEEVKKALALNIFIHTDFGQRRRRSFFTF